MQMRSALSFSVLILAIVFVGALARTAMAQSRDVNMPTPIRNDRFDVTIDPRPIGDPRLTTYYFTFGGSQGDVFLNTKATNFNGDVDVFIAGSLRPLAKMVFYADSGEFETGRVIYLRKSENLILRVEGRTPNDTQAKIEIRFAGSFVASTAADAPEEVRLTERVPEPVAKAEPSPKPDVSTPLPRPTPRQTAPVATMRKPEVVVTETKPPTASKQTSDAAIPAKPVQQPKSAAKTPAPRTSASKVPIAPPADPMALLRLVVMFKDGTKIERPMTEVIRFGIENSVLTIVAKNGSIGRYNMASVTSVTVQ